ncbi:hypothetical protein [Fluviicola chungangensis]|jgi:hypothetical protein|uniref:PQ-loop repeat-containing protein n=1 Tax=Fluviicola chungangensis TaxID=2597671 RepID=A0A556N7G4_9FLAO|nr:hypothetical protein [Fluviicola chungangensis]TSJ48061.1 hypothetical protein FO442_02705 [Fluviicola chungangensis]
MIIDFLTGVLLVNSLPHLLLGITKTRFLGMFGYKPKANIWYAVVQFLLALVLFHINHGIETILKNGIFLGAACTCFLFLIFGKAMMKFYRKK